LFACITLVDLVLPLPSLAQQSEWVLEPVEKSLQSTEHPLMNFDSVPSADRVGDTMFSAWSIPGEVARHPSDRAVAPAEFLQPATEEEMPRPSFLEPVEPKMTINEELNDLRERVKELETTKTVNEDALRTILGNAFAQRASNITDAVSFGGTLETLTFW